MTEKHETKKYSKYQPGELYERCKDFVRRYPQNFRGRITDYDGSYDDEGIVAVFMFFTPSEKIMIWWWYEGHPFGRTLWNNISYEEKVSSLTTYGSHALSGGMEPFCTARKAALSALTTEEKKRVEDFDADYRALRARERHAVVLSPSSGISYAKDFSHPVAEWPDPERLRQR